MIFPTGRHHASVCCWIKKCGRLRVFRRRCHNSNKFQVEHPFPFPRFNYKKSRSSEWNFSWFFGQEFFIPKNSTKKHRIVLWWGRRRTCVRQRLGDEGHRRDDIVVWWCASNFWTFRILLTSVCWQRLQMFRAKTKRTAKVVFHEVFLDGQQIGSTAIPRLHGKAMRPSSFSKCIFDMWVLFYIIPNGLLNPLVGGHLTF